MAALASSPPQTGMARPSAGFVGGVAQEIVPRTQTSEMRDRGHHVSHIFSLTGVLNGLRLDVVGSRERERDAGARCVSWCVEQVRIIQNIGLAGC
jgi:hypothetical protein